MTGTDILRLPHLRAATVEEHWDHYRILADGQGVPTRCPECRGESLSGHGRKKQEFMDVPIHGKRTLIEIERRRFRCKDCGKTLFSSLPDMDEKRLATRRMVIYVEQRCLRDTFAALSRDVGVDERTVRHIFDDYVARMQAEVKFETPEIMGIDELKIVGQYRAMITNVQAMSLFDMLKTRKKADLIRYFMTMPDKHKVRVITMDLWNVYRQVMENQFPGRLIVADRFHVLRMANDAMEKTRKAVRKTLDTRTRLRLKDDRFVLLARRYRLTDKQRETLADWEARFPVLGTAYAVKEAFHDLYEYGSRSEAEKAAQAWIDSIPQELDANFHEVRHALGSWWKEIFNWYECRISNGYTESINRLAKDMNRMGRGYSFDVIRARLVYDDVARQPTRKTVRKKSAPQELPDGFIGFAIAPTASDRVIEYGPHIPTLCDLLESGHFS